MLRALDQHIKKEKLFDATDQLLVGVSGGIDSIVLCHLLSGLSYKFTIAHMNFQLRGNNSVEDEKFTRNFARNLQVPFWTKRVETVKYARENGISIQMAARTLRYGWFEELTNELKLDYVITAHHADDNLETALLNLTKGTGIHGLRGIPSKVKNIVRPLLPFTKSEIEEYAMRNKLIWREDQSNQDNKYQRNKLRNEVIPEMKEINPDLSKNFILSQRRFAGLAELLDKEATRIESHHIRKDGERWILDLEWLSNPVIDLVVLHEILKKFGFGFKETIQVFEGLEEQPGKEFLNGGFRVVIDRGRILITKKSNVEIPSQLIDINDTELQTVAGNLKMRIENALEVQIVGSATVAYLDFNTLSFPLTIRKWKKGDHFYPLGMDHRKKLSDFFIDNKIDRIEKDKIHVVETGGEVCWIVGHRIDERFKVRTSTQKVFIIDCHQETK